MFQDTCTYVRFRPIGMLLMMPDSLECSKEKQPWTALNPTTISKCPLQRTRTRTHTHTYSSVGVPHNWTHSFIVTWTQIICTFLLKYTSIFQALHCSKCLWQVPVAVGESVQLQCYQFPGQRLKNALVFPNTRHCC